eukprot:3072181-Rhodomonas_salina.1
MFQPRDWLLAFPQKFDLAKKPVFIDLSTSVQQKVDPVKEETHERRWSVAEKFAMKAVKAHGFTRLDSANEHFKLLHRQHSTQPHG